MLAIQKKVLDEHDLVALIQDHKEQFYRVAFSYVKHEQDALDVIQESTYKAYVSLDKLKSPNYFKTWFTRILINTAIDTIRANSKVVSLSPSEHESMSLYEAGLSDHQISEMRMDLVMLLDHLNVQEREVVVLRYYEDYALKEIAEMIGKPLSSVKSILYRSLEKLKNVWEQVKDHE